jgi:carbamoyltransferase
LIVATKPIYVLGTGLSQHDGSTCILRDGKPLVVIEKERLTRHKHDGGNDAVAIRYCLDAAGITMADLSLIVQNANFGMFAFGNDWLEGERPLKGEVPVVTISHHLAHAYSAFGSSNFEDGCVLVIDGCGNSLDDCIDTDGALVFGTPDKDIAHLWHEKDSFYKIEGSRLKPLVKDFSPWGHGNKNYPMHPPTTRDSIGGVYAAASQYVFRGLEDAGKLMGLAPYGRPSVHDFPIFDLRDERVLVRYDWMKDFRSPARSFEEFKANFQTYADLAYWIQREVERAILYVVHARHARQPAHNLCYAGGVALNAVANRKILTQCPWERVHIQPAAGDNGLAIGCAYYGWLEVLKKERVGQTGSVYLGRRYQDEETAAMLRRYAKLVQCRYSQNPVADAVDQLVQGRIVGWFQGGSECGPRALGNRSILADPRLPDVRDRINAEVKFREDFRPFAPSVMAEDAQIFFDCDYSSPHMLLTAPVRPQWRDVIPAVVHQDGSARIQTVTADDNPLYYQLLQAFKEKTGIGVLLNTSLNRRGIPIVETPEDAMMMFIYSGLDVLVVNNFIVHKPPDFEARIAAFNKMLAEAAAQKTFKKAMSA